MELQKYMRGGLDVSEAEVNSLWTPYDDAQRALDAEREKVKRLSTCGTDHSTPWWQVKCEDLEAQLAPLQAQLRRVEGERNTARHRVDELEAREIDVEILQGDLATLQAQADHTRIERNRLWGELADLQAHRLSYELHKGPIPDGLTIDHL